MQWIRILMSILTLLTTKGFATEQAEVPGETAASEEQKVKKADCDGQPKALILPSVPAEKVQPQDALQGLSGAEKKPMDALEVKSPGTKGPSLGLTPLLQGCR